VGFGVTDSRFQVQVLGFEVYWTGLGAFPRRCRRRRFRASSFGFQARGSGFRDCTLGGVDEDARLDHGLEAQVARQRRLLEQTRLHGAY